MNDIILTIIGFALCIGIIIWLAYFIKKHKVAFTNLFYEGPEIRIEIKKTSRKTKVKEKA